MTATQKHNYVWSTFLKTQETSEVVRVLCPHALIKNLFLSNLIPIWPTYNKIWHPWEDIKNCRKLMLKYKFFDNLWADYKEIDWGDYTTYIQGIPEKVRDTVVAVVAVYCITFSGTPCMSESHESLCKFNILIKVRQSFFSQQSDSKDSVVC